ncbi:ABC transporter permease [Mucilaginibacter gynuensis]|uniref:ABC transporter permease n=1 Tax=Mucilaginibacter gynuensis TaxID=1302236 RepID=A0ABP8HIC5_9SPHI
MFKNYLVTAIRSLKRHKLFTVLNIFGLATGLTCSILIFLWVQDERSYDNFNDNAAQIYRLTAKVSDVEVAVVPPPVAPTLKQQVPAVKSYTTVVPLQTFITIGNRKFDEKNLLYAAPNFLQMFNYPLLQGDKATVLTRPDGVVLTASTAKKYFGSVNAIGKVIHADNDINGTNYVVTGILKDVPRNSHLQFDMLLPIELYNRSNGDVWDNFDVYSYVELDKRFNATPSAIAALQKQTTEIHTLNDKTHTKSTFTLQPLSDIHLKSRLMLDVAGQGNNQHVNIFTLVAIFILLIACINFMNLATALAGQRAKEVGLRKTIGAMRFRLIIQFLGESLLLAFLALIIALGAALLLLPFFNDLANKSISINLLNLKFIGSLLGIATLVGLISGSYPAFFLSSFKPIKVLKGVKVLSGNKNYFRNGLVIAQFAVSVVLMVSTLVVSSQLNFIRNRDIGFNKQNLLYLQMPKTGDTRNNYQTLKATLGNNTGTGDYTIIEHLPTYLTTGTTNVIWPGKDPRQQTVFPHIGIDENFIKTFGMHIIAGRNFIDNSKADEPNYILNETAVKVMGMTAANAIGQKISSNNQPGEVVGVVKDFNFKPIQQGIEPLILKHTNRGGYVVMRTSPVEIQQVITKLKANFQDVYPNFPFSYGFVDQDLSKLYTAEQQMGQLFNVFSVVSIIISCLGLFGLATFATQKRLKEIGVRRVFGASATGIVAMLAKDFVKLVAAALVVAFPVAWWAMNKWLDNYAYRTQMSWWMFALAGFMAIVIAFLTISYQSIKAALANPIDSLRTE